jgi:hypothetical protein
MKLQFNEWVESIGGANRLAEKLDVTGWAVRVWLRGEGAPLAETINTIIRLSKGVLTFEQIYKESTRSKK